MKSLFSIIFPLIDHLYIFQLFEYDRTNFLRWFLSYPLKRNLQRKHTLVFTKKAKIILFLSLLQLFGVLFFAKIYMQKDIIFLLVLALIIQFFSPLFLSISQIVLSPLEEYARKKVVEWAKKKRKTLTQTKIIAIVGSYAKTSTKEMLYALLWKNFYTVKTPKSFNTQLSVAQTILEDVKETTDVFLVEMDAYHKGEIAMLCDIAQPTHAVITAIAPQHLEKFASMDELVETQFEVVENLPEEGTVFLNSQDMWSSKGEREYKRKKVWYGKDTDDFNVTDIKQTEEGITFDFHAKKERVKITVPLFGKHHAMNFLAAATIAYSLGLDLKTIQKRALLLRPTEHRLQVKHSGTVTIIDNSFNANAVASNASFAMIKEYPGTQKIVVTPGLVELGKESGKAHKDFAKAAAAAADDIVIVGHHARKDMLSGLQEAAFPQEKIHVVETEKEGIAMAYKIAKPGAVILLENDLPDQYF